jgi:photosystem II stability/assembly factor-like uncharacterized protein
MDAVAEQAVIVAEFSSSDPVTPMPGVVGGGGGGGRGGGGRGGRGGAAAATTRSEAVFRAGVAVRWRVLGSGAVSRSTDNGATWTPIVIDPPAHVVGGAAPTAAVVWLIGREGVVLRSTDTGGTFERRVPVGPATEFTSIRASGAMTASVTTTDGRVYLTTDGGVSWRLQGSPAAAF